MIFKKNGGNIFGVVFNTKEQKAVDKEVTNQLSEYLRAHHTEMDALFLWSMHTQLKFGKKRLIRFYKTFVSSINDLAHRYEIEDNLQDKIWITKHQLKEIGVDLEELEELEKGGY